MNFYFPFIQTDQNICTKDNDCQIICTCTYTTCNETKDHGHCADSVKYIKQILSFHSNGINYNRRIELHKLKLCSTDFIFCATKFNNERIIRSKSIKCFDFVCSSIRRSSTLFLAHMNLPLANIIIAQTHIKFTRIV